MANEQSRLVLVVDTDQRFIDDARASLADQRLLSVHSLAEATEVALGGRVDLVLLGPAFASDVAITQATTLLEADPSLHLALVADVVTNRLLKAALRAGFTDVVATPLEPRDAADLIAQVDQRREISLVVEVPAPAEDPIPVAEATASSPATATFTAEPVNPAAHVAGFTVPRTENAPSAPAPAAPAPVVHDPAAPAPQPAPAPAVAAPAAAPQQLPEQPAASVQPASQPAVPVLPAPEVSIPPAIPPVPAPPEIDPAHTAFAPRETAPEPIVTAPAPDPVVATEPEIETAVSPPSAAAVLDDVLPPPPTTPPPSVASIETSAPAAASRPFVPRPARPGDGRVIAVMAGKGGSGKTVVATNLAIALGARRDAERVAIVDADLQFGDVALLLQVDPVRTLDDLVGRVEGMSDERLGAALLRHESGVRVLPAPVLPVRTGEIDAKQVLEIIERLRSMFDFVVVDTGPVFDDGLVSMLEYADDVVTVVDMDLPSVKNAKVALDRLRQGGFDVERIRLVVNRVNSKARLDLVELERSLGLRVGGSVPSDRLVPQSVNEGIPVLALSPRSKVARAFHALAESLDHDAERDRLNDR